MKLLADYTIDELNQLLNDQPKYRARQLFKWVSKGVGYDQMTDIPKSLRQELLERFSDRAVRIVKEIKAGDGSVKFLYQLIDGNIIEGMFLPNAYGNTLCVSTQVGCRMKCRFCASGTSGLIRHLSSGEIYGQVIEANKRFSKNGQRAISNIVLMGSGEPLDNFDATTKFINLVCSESGLNYSQRNISLSTCGIVDKIKRLADLGYSVTLSISLHATTQEVRSSLMPIAKKNINEVMDAAKYYFEKSGRRVIIEYITISGKNVSDQDAKRLSRLVKGFSSHINLIPLNYVKESKLTPASEKEIKKFESQLKELGLSVSIRKSAGKKVFGACGQLRNKFIKSK